MKPFVELFLCAASEQLFVLPVGYLLVTWRQLLLQNNCSLFLLVVYCDRCFRTIIRIYPKKFEENPFQYRTIYLIYTNTDTEKTEYRIPKSENTEYRTPKIPKPKSEVHTILYFPNNSRSSDRPSQVYATYCGYLVIVYYL